MINELISIRTIMVRSLSSPCLDSTSCQGNELNDLKKVVEEYSEVSAPVIQPYLHSLSKNQAKNHGNFITSDKH